MDTPIDFMDCIRFLPIVMIVIGTPLFFAGLFARKKAMWISGMILLISATLMMLVTYFI